MIDNDITFANIRTLSGLIKDKEISPVELISIFLEKIEKLNPVLSAFITIANESAYSDAQQAENLMNETLGVGFPLKYASNMLLAKVYMTLATNPDLGDGSSNYWQLAYDEAIKVEFVKRIRKEKQFDNLELLKKQLQIDQNNCKKLFRL